MYYTSPDWYPWSSAKYGPDVRSTCDAKARHAASGGTIESNERVGHVESGVRAWHGESGGTTRSNERFGRVVSGVSGTSVVNGVIDSSGAIDTSRARAQHAVSVTIDATYERKVADARKRWSRFLYPFPFPP
ncbi:hypothetical protein ACFE04_023297 [Oxalis oulophora]